MIADSRALPSLPLRSYYLTQVRWSIWWANNVYIIIGRKTQKEERPRGCPSSFNLLGSPHGDAIFRLLTVACDCSHSWAVLKEGTDRCNLSRWAIPSHNLNEKDAKRRRNAESDVLLAERSLDFDGMEEARAASPSLLLFFRSVSLPSSFSLQSRAEQREKRDLIRVRLATRNFVYLGTVRNHPLQKVVLAELPLSCASSRVLYFYY